MGKPSLTFNLKRFDLSKSAAQLLYAPILTYFSIKLYKTLYSREFCANKTIDQVYNTEFLTIVAHVQREVNSSIVRLGQGGIEILNLAIPKPEIPIDIAERYKEVKVQWAEQLVATQQQKTEGIKKETERIKVK